jgi:hypothetical protein
VGLKPPLGPFFRSPRFRILRSLCSSPLGPYKSQHCGHIGLLCISSEFNLLFTFFLKAISIMYLKDSCYYLKWHYLEATSIYAVTNSHSRDISRITSNGSKRRFSNCTSVTFSYHHSHARGNWKENLLCVFRENKFNYCRIGGSYSGYEEFYPLDVTPYGPSKVNRCFGGICCLHFQGRRISQALLNTFVLIPCLTFSSKFYIRIKSVICGEYYNKDPMKYNLFVVGYMKICNDRISFHLFFFLFFLQTWCLTK